MKTKEKESNIREYITIFIAGAIVSLAILYISNPNIFKDNNSELNESYYNGINFAFNSVNDYLFNQLFDSYNKTGNPTAEINVIYQNQSIPLFCKVKE